MLIGAEDAPAPTRNEPRSAHGRHRGRRGRGYHRPRRAPSGSPLFGVVALLMLGVIAALAVAQQPGGPLTGTSVDVSFADAGTDRGAQAASRGDARATPPPSPPPTAGPTRKPTPATPAPVAGLNQAQMANAAKIVSAGTAMGVPERALVVAVATALQESKLRNLANSTVPESLELPHQGVGSDHDSLGLFQQRPSQGWGGVTVLMDPVRAARAFYAALLKTKGWEDLSITAAAQRVQASAFPEAYAKYEQRARTIVGVLT